MPRLARIVIPSLGHHVTQRGNAQRDVFFTPQDREVYLGLLKQYSEHYALRILGYCLMTNHVHLVTVPEHAKSLSSTMREVHGRYSRYRNAIDRSTGHLWQNRYYACAFEGPRIAGVMRYVELNPVRAGIVRVAEDYVWSSALPHLGGRDLSVLIDLSAWRREWSTQLWADWLRDGTEDTIALREATYAGRVLGSQDFVRELEQKLGRRLAPRRPGRPKTKNAAAA